jgi:hypothetical protein
MKVIRYLLSKGNSQKGQLLAALAVFNREETIVWCSSVATPFNVPSLCLSLLFAFARFILTFAMGPGSTFHHQKTRQNHFFQKRKRKRLNAFGATIN